ncbi:hypothetical protein OGM63_04265 [Plectonema radiosum NIES-515]|uniref:Uncharacterized protein n=1 Tax=Plectonema radiosum NIES-515 TaxID=2986073 RepID=A0ABT3AUG3_9CYAN|nr:hypothetical protein [Plectonema radiosum]MCV3212748.1 hypothetical protein [Plectonema radiosum NIES-515]
MSSSKCQINPQQIKLWQLRSLTLSLLPRLTHNSKSLNALKMRVFPDVSTSKLPACWIELHY